jgi:AraC family carnitine catabolism transcriptional activator
MAKTPTHVSFLLVSGFMMAAYVLAADALRLANWRDGRRLFVWDVRTPDDKPAEANNGMIVPPDLSLEARPFPDAVFVCAGYSAEQGCSKAVFRWLRALERRGAVLGGWDTGPLVLAEAGLMDGRRMAVHWQAAPVIRERYPRVDVISDRCQIEKRRYTSPGGVSTFDLVVDFIEHEVGRRVAQMVAKMANRDISPLAMEPAPLTPAFNGSALLSRVVATMEENIEESPSIPKIAALCGLSERALYRVFRDQFGVTPKKFYLSLRLERARDLLMQSEMSVSEIASATGFNSLSRFSQAFRKFYGESAMRARTRPRWLQVSHALDGPKRLIRTDL